MPEASEYAAILIATSYQALKRAEAGDKATETTNCIVIILFAAFFIEENLNVIIKKMKKFDEMKIFFGNKKNPVMLDKLAWYYNYYVATSKVTSRKELYARDQQGNLLIINELDSNFPGFKKIHGFRNDVAHGTINKLAVIKNAEKLRQQAKAIVNELFKIAENAGYKIPRNITYQSAITKISGT